MISDHTLNSVMNMDDDFHSVDNRLWAVMMDWRLYNILDWTIMLAVRLGLNVNSNNHLISLYLHHDYQMDFVQIGMVFGCDVHYDNDIVVLVFHFHQHWNMEYLPVM